MAGNFIRATRGAPASLTSATTPFPSIALALKGTRTLKGFPRIGGRDRLTHSSFEIKAVR
jgi:hypothetical protein